MISSDNMDFNLNWKSQIWLYNLSRFQLLLDFYIFISISISPCDFFYYFEKENVIFYISDIYILS